MSQAAPLLLIGGMTTPRPYTKPLLESLAATGPLLAVDAAAPTWQRLFLTGGSQVRRLTAAHVLRMVRHLEHPVGGVLALEERLAALASEVAVTLRVPGYGARAAAVVGDKWLVRQRLQAAGCLLVRARLARQVVDAVAAAARIGYPVVVRPRQGASPARRVDSQTDLVLAFQSAAVSDPNGEVLVEAFQEGSIVTVVCMTQNGYSSVVAVMRAQVRFMPAAVTTQHLVDSGDLLRGQAWLTHLAGTALTGLGVENGISRITLCLTRTGPVILSVKAHLGTDLTAPLVNLATGVDLAVEAAAVARGQARRPPDREYKCAAAGYVHAPGPGRIDRLTIGEQLDNMPWVERLAWEAAEGDTVAITAGEPPPRLAHVIVTGRESSQCAAFLQRVRTQLSVKMTKQELAA